MDGEFTSQFVVNSKFNDNIFEFIFFVCDSEVMFFKIIGYGFVILFLAISLEDTLDKHNKDAIFFVKDNEEILVVGIENKIAILSHHKIELS